MSARRRPVSFQQSLLAARHKARRALVQALYQWQMGGIEAAEVERQFHSDQDLRHADLEYFHELLHGIPAHLAAIDSEIQPFLDRSIEAVDLVERACLRLGTYELAYRPDIPGRVAISEALSLAKAFGSEQGHKYVNGVLDRVAHKLRPDDLRRRAAGDS